MKKYTKIAAAAVLGMSMVFTAGAVYTINMKNIPTQTETTSQQAAIPASVIKTNAIRNMTSKDVKTQETANKAEEAKKA